MELGYHYVSVAFGMCVTSHSKYVETFLSTRASLKYLKEIELLGDALFLVQQLSVNVRSLCTETLFYNTAKGQCTLTLLILLYCLITLLDIEVLHEREDWRVQAEEGMVITSLVSVICLYELMFCWVFLAGAV